MDREFNDPAAVHLPHLRNLQELQAYGRHDLGALSLDAREVGEQSLACRQNLRLLAGAEVQAPLWHRIMHMILAPDDR